MMRVVAMRLPSFLGDCLFSKTEKSGFSYPIFSEKRVLFAFKPWKKCDMLFLSREEGGDMRETKRIFAACNMEKHPADH
ncbi:MAG TPA: hypothetical protein H9700_08150 [Candidatus Eisenbergiella intestinipullorum]|nr:hypothetical protein [Candidatus Eisenbergiella intestinipullorum]